MLKQSLNRLKKILVMLLAVLFVVSVTAAAVSAHMDMKNMDMEKMGKDMYTETDEDY
jgi:hypothetical protein